MRQMETLEFSWIMSELKPLAGKRYSKMQKLGEGKYRIKLDSSYVVIHIGIRINIAKYIEESEQQDNFVSFANKKLGGLRLESLEQHENDRVAVFSFSDGKKIVYEGFGDGNIILTENGKTLAAVKEEEWSDRKIKRGENYSYPKSRTIKKLNDAICDKYIISCMLKLPFGKEYAKEILQKLKIDEKTPGNKLSEREIKELEKEIAQMEKDALPLGFYEADSIIDYGLMKFSKHKNAEAKTFQTLSEAADEYYFYNREERNEMLEKLERRLQVQQKHLEELEKNEEELRQKGDFIYQQYETVGKILTVAKEEPNKIKGKIDKKEKTVEIELD